MPYRLRSKSASAGPATRPQAGAYAFRASVPPEADTTAIAERIRAHQNQQRRLEQVTGPTPTPVTERLAKTGRRKASDVLQRYNLRVSDETQLHGMFGTIRLMHGPENIDLSRIDSGLCGFCIDHDPSAVMGRIESPRLDRKALMAIGVVMDLPRSHDALRELRLGLRHGISPGFMVHDAESEESSNHRTLDLKVTRWEPYEVSSTTVPRNARARIMGEAGMRVPIEKLTTRPLVNTSDYADDRANLSAECLRAALSAGAVPEAKRETIETLIGAYDDALSDGDNNATAAQKAAATAGLRQ